MSRAVVVSSYASLFALGLADNIRGPLFADILRVFQISDGVGSLLFACSSFGGIWGAASCRFWLARWSRLRTLDIALVGQAMGLGIISVADRFAVIGAGSLLFGFSVGLMGVVQNALAVSAVRAESRSRVLGGLHAMYGLSSLLAPLLVAAIAVTGGSWRWAFVAAAAFSLGVAICNHFGVRDVGHGARSHEGLLRPKIDVSPSGRAAMIWLAAVVALYVFAEVMVSSRLALYYRRTEGWDLEASSFAVTAFFAALLVGRIVTSLVPIRAAARSWLVGFFLLGAAMIVAGLSRWTWMLPLSGLALGPIYPLCLADVGHEFGEHVDVALGWVNAAQSGGLLLMHVGVGEMTDAWGLSRALAVGPVVLVLGALMLGTYGKVFYRHAARI